MSAFDTNTPQISPTQVNPDPQKNYGKVLIIVIIALILVIAVLVGIIVAVSKDSVSEAELQEAKDQFVPPAQVAQIDMTADDPSDDNMKFKYDDRARIISCTYSVNQKTYEQIYTYHDDIGMVTIETTYMNHPIYKKEIEYSKVREPGKFEAVEGYYLRFDKDSLENAGATSAPTEKLPESKPHEYVAEELINKDLNEIIKIMGGDFDMEESGPHLIYYTSGGFCIYNDDTLPGFAFFIDDAEKDFSKIVTEEYEKKNNQYPDEDYDQAHDAAYKKIKEKLKAGEYHKISFIGVYDHAKYDERISADMTYTEVSEVLGSSELSSLAGAGFMSQKIPKSDNGEQNDIIYYNTPEELHQYIVEKNGYQTYDENKARELNPTIFGIAVFPTKKSSDKAKNTGKSESIILETLLGANEEKLFSLFGKNYSNTNLPESGLMKCSVFESFPNVAFGFSNTDDEVVLIGVTNCDQSVKLTEGITSDMTGSQLHKKKGEYTINEGFSEATQSYIISLRNNDGLILSFEWDSEDYMNTVPDYICMQFQRY